MALTTSPLSAADFENPLCVASQEWTYAWDNAFTRFVDNNRFRITLSDGRTVTFLQEATTGWTAQLQAIATASQAATDAIGLQWLTEPRFVDNNNPTVIDGTINGPVGTPSGLPGAPDPIIAQAIVDSRVAWRYVNNQICPGDPVPVKVELIEVNGVERNPPRAMTQTPAAILGPKNRFRVGMARDKSGASCEFWEIYDKALFALDKRKPWREATDGEIPFCYFKEGDSAASAVPPEASCTFRYTDGCDSNGSENLADFTTGVVRRATFCPGEKVKRDFLIADPDDPTAFVEYDLKGKFVDCATGKEIPVQPPPCETAAYAGQVWRVKPDAQLQTTVDYWGGPNFPTGQTSAPHGNVSSIFTVSADGSTLEHVNGAPSVTFVADFTDIRTSNANFIAATGAGSSGGTSGNDQIRVRGYINLNSPALLRDVNPNTGERGGIWINKCCAGSLELLFEDTTDSVSGDTGIFGGVRVPVGRHYFEAVTSDLSAWQGFQLDASFDDGATYAPLAIYDIKPEYECVTLFRCEPSGVLIERETGALYEAGLDELECEPPACVADPAASGGGGTVEIDEQALAAAIVAEQRNVTPRVMNFTNEGGVEQLRDAAGNPYPAGTLGTLVSVEDIGTGFVRWSIDGSVPTTQEGTGFTTTGPYHAAYNLHNVDLSLVRLDGSSANSDYSVAFEVYN